ncbi:hypothetical protein ABZ851_23560 [Streptomyces sp. NPDC047049]|uniref:hypothetical protein n=1 Tax=Streptomyces sp. NPDC047049 TaxID=3156688 RepID=UPI0033CD2E3B
MADHVGKFRKRAPHTTASQRLMATTAAMLSLLLLTSGCGGPKVNYSIPSSLCGIHVGRDLLRPFFPPGDRVEFDGDSFPGDTKAKSFCQYYVDGNTALWVDGKRSSENATAAQKVKRFASHAHIKYWTRSDGRIAGYSGNVFGTSSCSGTPSESDGQPARSFALEIAVTHFTSTNAVRPRLEKLMNTLLPKAAHARGC